MITDEQILKAKENLNVLIETQWINEFFLSPIWIFLLALILFAYALFIYLVDKKRIIEILLYGSLVAVSFAVYDSIAQHLNYWVTLKGVLPIEPHYFLGNLTLIPLFAMLVYQYTSSWRRYLIWITVWAGLLVFVYYNLLLSYFNIFVYIKRFSAIIDFTLFLASGIIARWIIVSLLKLERKRKYNE